MGNIRRYCSSQSHRCLNLLLLLMITMVYFYDGDKKLQAEFPENKLDATNHDHAKDIKSRRLYIFRRKEPKNVKSAFNKTQVEVDLNNKIDKIISGHEVIEKHSLRSDLVLINNKINKAGSTTLRSLMEILKR